MCRAERRKSHRIGATRERTSSLTLTQPPCGNGQQFTHHPHDRLRRRRRAGTCRGVGDVGEQKERASGASGTRPPRAAISRDEHPRDHDRDSAHCHRLTTRCRGADIQPLGRASRERRRRIRPRPSHVRRTVTTGAVTTGAVTTGAVTTDAVTTDAVTTDGVTDARDASGDAADATDTADTAATRSGELPGIRTHTRRTGIRTDTGIRTRPCTADVVRSAARPPGDRLSAWPRAVGR